MSRRSSMLFSILLLSCGAGPAGAAPRVTVYGGDLGFVVEDRVLDLGAAGDTARLDGLPERIDPSSIRLAPERGRVTRLAYRFDVASGDGLLESARGSRVRVVSRGDRVVEGRLIAADGAWLVIRLDDGAIVSLARAAVEDVRLASPPPSLSWRPTLEAVIQGAPRGRVGAELSYLTGGLTWSAEHTVIREGEGEATWSAAALVQNTTGRDFVDATLDLVAGQPHRQRAMPPPMPYEGMMMRAQSAEVDASLTEQAFSEYHLYALDGLATLRDRETQRLTMLDPRAVRVTPRYVWRAGMPGVAARLEVVNSAARGLGVPLAAGRVRFYERGTNGALHFTGESAIRHTPEGETVTLDVGTAFDLAAERREVASRALSVREREVEVEVKLRNRKTHDVTIVVEEPVSPDHDVVKRTHPLLARDAGLLAFEVPVRAGGEVTVRWTVRLR